jgi:hypothetical protein
VKTYWQMSESSMSVLRRTLLSKEGMAEAIKGIVKGTAVVMAGTGAISPQQLLLLCKHLLRVHLEPLARLITAHNMPNIMVPVAKTPTQHMVVTRTIWQPINTTLSRPPSNQPRRGPLLQAHQVMTLHPLHPQEGPRLRPMVAIIL